MTRDPAMNVRSTHDSEGHSQDVTYTHFSPARILAWDLDTAGQGSGDIMLVGQGRTKATYASGADQWGSNAKEGAVVTNMLLGQGVGCLTWGWRMREVSGATLCG